MLSFHYLEIKYGGAAAYHWLQEIEKVAGIQSWRVASSDPEIRLRNALRAQDAMCESSLQPAA